MMASGDVFPKLSADEAAQLIGPGSMVAFSGFTPAGAAKAVPVALARRAVELHRRGQPFQIRVLTGASTGRSLDDALAEAMRAGARTGSKVRPVVRPRSMIFSDSPSGTAALGQSDRY